MLQTTTLYLSFVSLATTVRSSNKRRVCKVRIKPDHSPNITTYKEVICVNSACCDDGCCTWYLNIFIYAFAAAFMLLCFVLIWKIIEKCWRAFCRNAQITNESQEDMFMMSTDQLNSAHRDGLQNYGSNASPYPTQARPPTYEEATSTR